MGSNIAAHRLYRQILNEFSIVTNHSQEDTPLMTNAHLIFAIFTLISNSLPTEWYPDSTGHSHRSVPSHNRWGNHNEERHHRGNDKPVYHAYSDDYSSHREEHHHPSEDHITEMYRYDFNWLYDNWDNDQYSPSYHYSLPPHRYPSYSETHNPNGHHDGHHNADHEYYPNHADHEDHKLSDHHRPYPNHADHDDHRPSRHQMKPHYPRHDDQEHHPHHADQEYHPHHSEQEYHPRHADHEYIPHHADHDDHHPRHQEYHPHHADHEYVPHYADHDDHHPRHHEQDSDLDWFDEDDFPEMKPPRHEYYHRPSQQQTEPHPRHREQVSFDWFDEDDFPKDPSDPTDTTVIHSVGDSQPLPTPTSSPDNPIPTSPLDTNIQSREDPTSQTTSSTPLLRKPPLKTVLEKDDKTDVDSLKTEAGTTDTTTQATNTGDQAGDQAKGKHNTNLIVAIAVPLGLLFLLIAILGITYMVKHYPVQPVDEN